MKKFTDKEIDKIETDIAVKSKHLNEELEKIENLIKACRQIKRYYDKNEINKIIHKLTGIKEGISIGIQMMK